MTPLPAAPSPFTEVEPPLPPVLVAVAEAPEFSTVPVLVALATAAAPPPAPAGPPPEPTTQTAFGLSSNGPTTDLYTELFGKNR